MIDLAMVNRKQTFERISGPLEERGITVSHLPVHKRAIDLQDLPWSMEAFDVGFVYPRRVMEGAIVDAATEIPWINGRDAILTSRNKGGVLARLERDGLPIPETVVVSNPVDEEVLRAVFERFEPPVVVKPNSTTRGVGIAKAADLDSFLGLCDYVGLVHDFRGTGDKSFIVQEFIPDATDYRIMVLDGEYVGAVERTIEDANGDTVRWKHNVHRGATAAGVDLDPSLRTLAERVATTLDIRFIGVDLLVSGDRAVVNETNARPTIDDPEKYESGFFDALAETIRDVAESE